MIGKTYFFAHVTVVTTIYALLLFVAEFGRKRSKFAGLATRSTLNSNITASAAGFYLFLPDKRSCTAKRVS